MIELFGNKPKEASDEDWRRYIFVNVASMCNMPVGMDMFNAYLRVKELIDNGK